MLTARQHHELEIVRRYQSNGYLKPFTYEHRDARPHIAREGEWEYGILEPRTGPDGAVCLACRDCCGERKE